MDYYIVVDGQKQGPYDLIGFVKKIKGGHVTAQTQVALKSEGPFLSAGEIPEIAGLLESQVAANARHIDVNMGFFRMVSEGFDLWVRRVVDYTLVMGVVIVVGYVIALILTKIPFIEDHAFIAYYPVGFVTLTLVGLFYHYTLLTKRSQEPNIRDINAVLRGAWMRLLPFSAIMAIPGLTYGFSPIITTVVMELFISFFTFVPFLILDRGMKPLRAMGVSIKSVLSLKAFTMAGVFIFAGLNLTAALVPTIFSGAPMMLGLMFTIPMTIAILSYIYDQIVA